MIIKQEKKHEKSKIRKYKTQQILIITTLLRASVWLVWFFLIALDGLSESLYWLPFVGMGLLMAWVLDGFIRDEYLGRAFMLSLPYLVLADFVQG